MREAQYLCGSRVFDSHRCSQNMNMKNQDNHTNILIEKIKRGDNKAWEELLSQYENYIHSRAWEKIKGLNVSDPQAMEEELFAAGWIGFISALKNHDTGKGSFATFATYYIDGEIKKQLDFEFNSAGLADKPKGSEISRVYAPAEDDKAAYFDAMLSRTFAMNAHSGISIPAPKDLGDYTAERRTLQTGQARTSSARSWRYPSRTGSWARSSLSRVMTSTWPRGLFRALMYGSTTLPVRRRLPVLPERRPL